MAQDSVETWRLYSAEASVPVAGGRFANLQHARLFLSDVQASSWWRWHVRDTVTITLDDIGNEIGGSVNSFSQPRDDPPTSWITSMHPQQLDSYHLLHEVAHCIAPRWHFGRPTSGSEIPAHFELAFHGAHFATTRLVLTEQFASPQEADGLRDAFLHFGVAVIAWSEVVAGMEDTRRAEADPLDLKERDPEGFAAGRSLLRRQGTALPPDDLGVTLLLARHRARLEGRGRRLSQERVAGLISAVVLCRARDVSRVERLTTPPAGRRLYQVALCMAVLLDLDPVQAQYQLGLDREDDWDVPLERLAVLNAGWVDLVRELDQLIRSRPPRLYA